MSPKLKNSLYTAGSVALMLIISAIVKNRGAIMEGIHDIFTSSNSNQPKVVMIDDVNYQIFKDGEYAYVTALPDDAKYTGCVTVPDSIKYRRKKYPVMGVAQSAFYNCKELTQVNLPAYVNWIGESAFSGCENLQTCPIPEGSCTVHAYAFRGCNSLRELSIPSGCTIMRYAFAGCRGLEKIVFERAKQEEIIVINFDNSYVREGAFSGCTSLRQVVIEKKTFSFSSHGIDDDKYKFIPIFADCPNLTEFIIADDCLNVSTEDGVLFNKDKTELRFCPVSKKGVYRIPASVKKIESSAFLDCVNLTEVYLPFYLQEISYNAFNGCTNLVVYYPSGTQAKYQENAFDGCKGVAAFN